MQRSELVTVPSFSPHAAAGSNTCARAVVSVAATQSDTTTNSQRLKAARTLIGIRQADDWIGGGNPDRLDASVMNGIEQINRLQSGCCAMRGLRQKACTIWR